MFRYRVAVLAFVLFLCCFLPFGAWADETATFTTSAVPNVLIILDNSNSMDQDFYGNAVTSWRTDSRLVQAKKAIIDYVVTPYVNQLRIGLMTYAQNNVQARRLHYADYFRSYNPASYCAAPPQECVDYCVTGDAGKQATCQASCAGQNASFSTAFTDELFTDLVNYPYNNSHRENYCKIAYPKTQRMPNPTSPGDYTYYKVPGTYYSPTNDGTAFCYVTAGYVTTEAGTGFTPYNFDCYGTKTNTNDNFANYGTYRFSSAFQATDEDIALGFNGQFGRRQGWSYSGRTWFANSSPGGGYLDVKIDTNTSNSQLNSLLAKLATHENDETGYMTCGSAGNGCAHVVSAGLTPTAGTFATAFTYFQSGLGGGKPSPIQYYCQPNFIIYVTDGLPSVAENGTTGNAAALKAAVEARIIALRSLTKTISGQARTFDIKTYVLGVGMTAEAKTMLNAFAQAGDTSVNGSAYYADNPAQLSAALSQIVQDIIDRTYSFSTASVKSNRLQDEDYIYVASFDPMGNKSFWPGHLQRYQIDPNTNEVSATFSWDAAIGLVGRSADSRTVFTFTGSQQSFTDGNTNITQSMLGAATPLERTAIINFIRGGSSGYKLGDPFHSNPINVSASNRYYQDMRDLNNAFSAFRATNTLARTGDNKIILIGANDGQLHAFGAASGSEVWSFIPPNLMPKLKTLMPPNSLHGYLVDGPLSVSDAWIGSGDGTSKSVSDWKTIAVIGLGKGVDTQGTCASNCNSCLTPSYCYKYNVCLMNNVTCKDSQDRCVTPSYLWSASPNCDSNFSPEYNTGTAPYYCGYHALNVTNTTSPSYLWSVRGVTSGDGPYLGEAWSRMAIGKVLISGQEKWVGFFGGGFNPNNCSGGGSCDTRAKGFFVVDMSNGQILWRYTYANNASMTHSMVSGPAIVDTDSDGFIDSAYVGDLQGNIWRFKFCKYGQPSCSTSNWTASLMYDALAGGEGQRPIYGQITAARDTYNNLWIYWVTGDRADPTATSTNEKVFGLREDLPNQITTYRAGGGGNFENVTSLSQTCSNLTRGWYMNFTGQEKSFSDVSVFGGVIYFSTYEPPSSCSNPCESAGTSRFYAIRQADCSGAISGQRSISLGGGMASSPIMSVSSTGQGGVFVTLGSGAPYHVPIDPGGATGTRGLFWRDRRVQ